MPRYRDRPLTLRQLQQDGPPVRLRDLCNISGLSDMTLRREIADEQLKAHKLRPLKNSTYFVDRAEARRWLVQIGFLRTEASV
jgi:hypothetical protein